MSYMIFLFLNLYICLVFDTCILALTVGKLHILLYAHRFAFSYGEAVADVNYIILVMIYIKLTT